MSFTEQATTGTARARGSRRLFARMATVVLAALMLIAGFGVAAPDSGWAGQAGTINANNVQVFRHLNDHTVIATLDAGDRVDIFWGPEGEMYEVNHGGTVGWIWAEFLDVDGGSSSSTSSSSSSASSGSSSSASTANAWAWSAWAMVDADSLNVRSDASSSAGVLDSYGPGEWIEVIGNDVAGFSPINYYGDVAWVASKYLSWDGTYKYASVGQTGGGSASSYSSARSSDGERWVQVNGRTGEVSLMVGNSVHATYWGSVGFDTSSDGFYSTANGTFYVYAMWEPLGYTEWAEAYISNWVAYDSYRSNGFHSYTKDANGSVLPNGAGKTGGCVALSAAASNAVFNWSYIGMRVVVYR